MPQNVLANALEALHWKQSNLKKGPFEIFLLKFKVRTFLGNWSELNRSDPNKNLNYHF